jgi:hypothetical protein
MERELYFAAEQDFAELSQPFSFPSQHFIALLVANTTKVPDETLAAFSRMLLQSGCSYFCVWGPGCERAHNLFDQECLFAPKLIMTTWHADESLDDAIWYFLRTTFPDTAFEETTAAALALAVGDPGWAAHVERRLRDIPALADDVLQEV